MTLSYQDRRELYNGNGATTSFSIPFEYFDNTSNVRVILVDSDGTETVQSYTTHYTINTSTDTVNMVTAPSNTQKLLIMSNLTLQQQVADHNDTSPMVPTVVERAIDTIAAQVQQLDEEMNRAVKLRRASTATDPYITEDLVAASVVVTNDDGTGFEMGPTLADFDADVAAAAASAAAAATSATSASSSASSASTSATNAATSATAAAASATTASTAATNASNSATAAAASEAAAAASEAAAAASETAAAASETAAATSATNAATSETNAAASETNAAASESNAATSETNAANSAAAAATSETNAAASAAAAAAVVSDGDKGDVVVSSSGTVWTVDSNAVSNTKLADMATQTIKGRTTAGTGDPEDLTAAQATAILDGFVGDSGSGGTKGLVPAPAAGDAAANKYLKADGTWTSLTQDHGALTGLTDDDHTQYALLAGRSGGQTLRGGTAAGDDLTLSSTANATKGTITAGIVEVDEVNNRVGVGMGGSTPSYRLQFRAGADDYAHGMAVDHVSGGANSLWRLYPDLNSTLSLYNPNQTTYAFQISATAQQMRLGEGGQDGGAVNIRNHTGKTTHHTLVLKKLASQTGDMLKVFDTNGSTTLASVSASGAGTFAGVETTAEVTAAEIATPSSPASGKHKIYMKSDGLLYKLNSSGVETPVGSGVGGINLVVLDTAANSWAVTKVTNSDAESSVGDWVAYADAAATSPADMTGGSPGTAITRITTSQLNGRGSFQMALGSGSSRQGEGVSLLVNVPTAYRGRSLELKFPFSITGSVVEDDLRLFVYDVTNSTVITPFTTGKLIGSSGVAQCVFPVSTSTAQIRVGIHVARTATTSLTVVFDDVQVSPFTVPAGMAGSDWVRDDSLITPVNFGSYTNLSVKRRRVGDVMEVEGFFKTGTTSASVGRLDITGYNIDTAKKLADSDTDRVNYCGEAVRLTSAGGREDFDLYWQADDSNSIYINNAAASSTFQESFASQVGDASGFAFKFTIPVSGWSSNVSMGESSSFYISSYLANGTRVTATPTRLGEYRSQLRNSSAQTFTDTNGSPGAAPSNADGIRLYGDNAYTSASSNNEPTRYDIFVGKNKVVRPFFYKNSGRTGFVDVSPQGFTNANAYGIVWNYDPTTGIFTTRSIVNSSVSSSHSAGLDDSFSAVADAYFDVLVSENALAVSSQQPRSYVRLSGGNGRGSTNTTIRRFTTTHENVGYGITYADSAANGASFTINESGVYAITYGDNYTSGTLYFGISKNSAQLTTSISSITAADRMFIAAAYGGTRASGAGTFYFQAGDVIRPHCETTADATAAADVFFAITKVSN